jgi:amino acid adenylation domain-containing protein
MKNKILICEDFDNDIRWQPGERLHHLFEHRCDELSENGNAQHLAVDGTKGAWSYKELDQGANQLARYLKIKGLGAGDVIGLLFDKDVHSYVSMLAVLKIHAAYVPLDPAFPEDRIAFIAEDAALKSILTTSPYLQLTESSDLPIISLDTVSAQIESQENTRLHEEETGQPVSELCYVIYTSGSTGRPKGVPIEHASICNFVRVAAEVYDYRSTDRVYQGLTLAFDFSVEEIWIPLVVGATLLPNQTGSSLLGADLSEFLRKHRATAMCCVPTLLATIEEDLPELRFLIVSGEACPGDLIRRWYSPKRTILNAYGPTEATVTATLSWPKPNEPVTIGKPLPTYSIVILEPGTQQVLPFGELGEIAVAGIGVARGYLNREDQTQKAFIDDFLNIPNNPAGLIYRTGDLGRINENGDIEYRGRIDTQVKIRGYRIELSEIESVIMQIPQVGQAVVDTFEPVPGVQELVAYYTLKDGAEPLSLEELVDLLRSLLPNYMVPAFYEHLQIIPMMTSDKVDRKALPAPSGLRMCADEDRIFVEPQNPLERDIARVLAGLLKLDTVSVEDDFFDDLGANSLLMAQFSSRLRSELGIADFSMREIYTSPSVRKLSEFLGSTGQKQMPLIRNNPSHRATNWQYIFSGFAQLVPIFAGILLSAFILWKGYSWIIEAPSSLNAYGRTILFSTAAFVLSVLIPVGLKWLLIGKWQPEEFPVWSLRYLRFWFVRKITQFNPMAVFAGSPLYIGYLKLLGARVSWKCFIRSGVPVCTDLFSIGEGAVVSKRAILSGYRAESGRITTGGITLERDTFVGEAAVLDIDTVMEAGSELAHASSLQKGQRLEAGKSYHGSPAQQTENRYRQLENGTASVTRMVLYSLVQLVLAFFVFGPLPILIIHHFLGADHNSSSTRIGELLPETKTLNLAIAYLRGTHRGRFDLYRADAPLPESFP